MSKPIITAIVLNELYPGKRWRIPTFGKDILLSDIIKEDTFDIDEDLVNKKIAELEAAEPMRLLRIERNRKLTGTDWRMVKDYKGTDQADWEVYRQALRDLPATSEPKLENGQLTNITWPEVPE